MRCPSRRWAGSLLLAWGFLLSDASAAPEPEWQLVADRPVLIRTRARPNSPVREVWAEGDMAASAVDLQAVLLDVASYGTFMPYMKESRDVPPPAGPQTSVTYLRLQLPIVGARDYVLQTRAVSSLAPDGTGRFQSQWHALPDRLPPQRGVTRLKVNEGTWTVTPTAPGKSHAVYRFAVDPGGWIPAFAADLGNKSAVLDTWAAVERQAQKRAAGRAPPTPVRPSTP